MADPNIVMIMIDATRADRLSCYGYDRPTTPNLDRIAREGVLYENAFTPDVWTLPVMASVFTGKMPHRHGVTFSRPHLSPEHATLASLLARRGYATAAISCSSWISRGTRLDRGFETFWEAYRLFQACSNELCQLVNRFYAKYIFRHHDKGARRVTQTASRWLRHKVAPPFFLFLHYLEPHYPYRPPQPYDGLYFEDLDRLRRAKQINHHPLDFFAGRLTLSGDDFALLNRLYDAEIAYLDAQIGHIYGRLAESGQLDHTVLVIFADHGENIGHHGLLDHHFCLYDSLMRVPLIIRYPSRFPSGERISSLVENLDVFETVLNLAGVDELSSSDSQSLDPTVLRDEYREYVVAETRGDFLKSVRTRSSVRDVSHYDRNLWAVRTDRYKFIRGDDVFELYDLRADPDEQVNIAAEKPELCKRLSNTLRREFPETTYPAANGDHMSEIEDPVLLDRLRSLGYVD